MSGITNVIKVLETAQTKAITGSLTVLNKSSGMAIPEVSVRYESDFDYIIFNNSLEPTSKGYVTKFSTVESKIDVNPGAKSKANALHIKIDCILRTKISQLYEDLMLNFDPLNTDESVWAVIEDYSDLLRRSKMDRLSNEEEVGLVGELVVLNELINNGHGEKALDYWKGPLGGLHDFVKKKSWELEVKTSLNPNPVAKVHPIEQLEPISIPFHLVIMKLKNDKKKGTSLPEWVDLIKLRLSSAKKKKEFESLLLEAGYKDEHRLKYTRNFLNDHSERYKIDKSTQTLCPINIDSNAKYVDIRWTLRSSDYPMIACDPAFWKNPV